MTMKIFAQALTDLGDATAAHQSKGRTHRSLAEPLNHPAIEIIWQNRWALRVSSKKEVFTVLHPASRRGTHTVPFEGHMSGYAFRA
jgi:hypothetical protein